MIWRLFKHSSSHKLHHLLCHGFERSGSAFRRNNVNEDGASSIPGLVSRYPNSYVHTLKGPLWCRLHAVLGEDGDRIMMDMLTNCALFRPVDDKFANYYQLSGPPISDLEPVQVIKAAPGVSSDMALKQPGLVGEARTLSKIAFVRSRMLYAKAALNAKGGIRFGMRHIRQCAPRGLGSVRS